MCFFFPLKFLPLFCNCVNIKVTSKQVLVYPNSSEAYDAESK